MQGVLLNSDIQSCFLESITILPISKKKNHDVWEFLDDPLSRYYVKSLKTNQFIVGSKIKLDTYLTSQNILYFKG